MLDLSLIYEQNADVYDNADTLSGPECISIDLHTIGTREMQPPRYSVKWTLGLAPTVHPPT